MNVFQFVEREHQREIRTASGPVETCLIEVGGDRMRGVLAECVAVNLASTRGVTYAHGASYKIRFVDPEGLTLKPPRLRLRCLNRTVSPSFLSVFSHEFRRVGIFYFWAMPTPGVGGVPLLSVTRSK